jgi:hypothetical protein
MNQAGREYGSLVHVRQFQFSHLPYVGARLWISHKGTNILNRVFWREWSTGIENRR